MYAIIHKIRISDTATVVHYAKGLLY